VVVQAGATSNAIMQIISLVSTHSSPTTSDIHCVSKKRHLFYFCDIFVKFESDSANFWQKHAPGNLKQTHLHAQFISRFICSYCTLQKLSTRQNAHSDVGRFLFVFSLNWNFAPSLKAYLNFWHYNLYQKIHELTYYPQKHEICINFLSKCELQWRLIAAWSFLVCISVSSARQSTTWRGRLRACVRTDGRDFKHLLG